MLSVVLCVCVRAGVAEYASTFMCARFGPCVHRTPAFYTEALFPSVSGVLYVHTHKQTPGEHTR